MRLWHKDLIPYLPRQQLLGQWRECCAIAKNIAEKGTPNHVLVNRIMDYDRRDFDKYTYRVWEEMARRGFRPDWNKYGKIRNVNAIWIKWNDKIFKGWHNDRYLRQCLTNLQEKSDCGAIPEKEWERITSIWPEWR